jgi:hypothetical protein
MKRVLAVAAAAGAALALSAAPAHAGEVNGQGEELAHNGASICQFSGLNDDPTGGGDPSEAGRVQSYGQSVKFYKNLTGLNPPALDALGIPGYECNPAGARSGPKE